ncbi:hypothetical protein LCGC14_0451270 [marine sediment metagenome]|uniref:PD-(D/E)XK endonuclease-like domain-containing protein n=1 Tax=marine sediment metagenome TaxID=412755 RepID=A0A0F9V4N5_9ZZZZ
MKAQPRGIYHPTDPHSSFTEITLADECEKRHDWEYRLGHPMDSRMATFGKKGHESIAKVNIALMENKDGISEEDIEGALVSLTGFKDYGYYAKFCDWMRDYAAKSNMERSQIIGVEVPIEAPLHMGPGQRPVKIQGKIDRLDRLDMGECAITDFKLWGLIPSQEELEADFQMGLYNWCLRYPPLAESLGLNPLRTFRKRWVSIFHDITMEAKADLKDADDAERYARSVVTRMMGTHKREPTFNRRCTSCGLARRCKALNREMGGIRMAKIITPSIEEYVKYSQRAAVIGEMREKVQTALKRRLEEYGKPIIEKGLKAYLRHDPGGQEVKFTRAPFTAITVKRIAKGARK